MSQPDGGPAFSRPWSIVHDGTKRWWREAQDGMTLRQWYAGMALQGLLTRDEAMKQSEASVAACCYRYADEMLAVGELR